jgi:hypothetical protein
MRSKKLRHCARISRQLREVVLPAIRAASSRLFSINANEPTGASGATITPMGNEVIDGDYCDVWKIHDNDSAFPLHTIWIAVEDGLPRKYLEGEPDNPQGLIVYSDYNTDIPIEVPPDPFAR